VVFPRGVAVESPGKRRGGGGWGEGELGNNARTFKVGFTWGYGRALKTNTTVTIWDCMSGFSVKKDNPGGKGKGNRIYSEAKS